GHSMQDVYSAIFCVSAQTNDGRNIQIEFPKSFGQPVSRPKLLLARETRARTEIPDQVGLSQNDSRGAIDFGCGRIAAGIGEIGDGESCIHDRVHRHHRPATAGAVKTNEAFGLFGSSRRQLCEIKCAAMITLFDSIGDAFESSRWMIELARDFDS